MEKYVYFLLISVENPSNRVDKRKIVPWNKNYLTNKMNFNIIEAMLFYKEEGGVILW